MFGYYLQLQIVEPLHPGKTALTVVIYFTSVLFFQ